MASVAMYSSNTKKGTREMNCQKCGLPQDTGAMGSVLPQCICHWKYTPVTNKTEYEFNIERLEKLVKQLQAEMGCYKLELELHKAMIQELKNALRKAQE